jgi:hypothetical protein
MELFLIIVLIVLLYWRTQNYYYLIDDIVRRWGYLLEIPENSPDPAFFSIKPPKVRHMFLTLTHAVNVSIIYFLWGWQAALVFAVHPLAVSCTAWVTGGYYQITTFLTLTAYFFLVKIPGIYGALIAATFFTAALGSTITCIGIPFLFLFFQPVTGLALFWPLAFYLNGRRFKIGFRKRNIGKGDAITIRKPILMAKVLAHYIKLTVLPIKLAFFQPMGFEYGKDPQVKKDLESVNKHFWESAAIILVFSIFGFIFSPFGTMFFLMGILPFTQWKVLGQFIAERYMYLPLVGWAIILGSALSSIWVIPVLAVIAGLYIYRSHKYIPAFRNLETLYQNGIEQYPDCVSNYVNLAERKLHTGELFEAYKLLKQGLEIDKKSFLCHANMAAYWLAINRPEMGKYHTEMAIRFSDNRGMAYNIFRQQLAQISRGMTLMAQGQEEVNKFIQELRTKKLEEEVIETKEAVPCGTPS